MKTNSLPTRRNVMVRPGQMGRDNSGVQQITLHDGKEEGLSLKYFDVAQSLKVSNKWYRACYILMQISAVPPPTLHLTLYNKNP